MCRAGYGVEQVVLVEVIHSGVEVKSAPEASVAWVKDLNPGTKPRDAFSLDSHVGRLLDSFPVYFPQEICLAGEDVVVPVCGHFAGGRLHELLLGSLEFHGGES